MFSNIKKHIIFFAVLAMVLTLVGCGGSKDGDVDNQEEILDEQQDMVDEEKEPEEINEEEPEEVADVETDDEDEEEEEKTTDEEEAVRDPEKMKEHLSGSIGEGEEITEIKIDGNDIFITVDLGDNEDSLLSDKDLACSRYSSITDKLLEDEFWNDITIEFKGVGKLTMNSSQAETNEFGGKYFDSLYIDENLE